MLDGKDKSKSTIASVLAFVINDARKLLTILGGKKETAYMYAGLGDLLLTCMSDKSRNYTFGKNLAKYKDVKLALENMKIKTVEGLQSLDSIYELMHMTGHIVKSIDYIYDVVYNAKDIDKVLKEISG